MVGCVDGFTKGEACSVIVRKRVEVDGKCVVSTEEEERVLLCDAKFVEGIAECGGVWFGGCEDDPEHVVYFRGVIWSADAHLLGGDDVYDVGSCHDVGKVGREWAGGRHVVFPARAEGKKDEEAEVAEGVTVLIFFWAEECVGANSFD